MVSRVERNRMLGRAFEKAVRRKPLAWRTRALWKLNGARRGLKLVGVDTEAAGEVRERLGERIDGRKWCEQRVRSRNRVRSKADAGGAR